MNRGAIALARSTILPAVQAGWFDLGYAVLDNGELAILRGDAEARACLGFASPPVADAKANPPERKATVSLSTFDGVTESHAVIVELEFPFPHFDRLADGGWIVVGARCQPGDNNARLFNDRGDLVGEYCLGDGIGHLKCTAAGEVWVGYFDEGIFGNLGWGEPNRPVPIGRCGLIRFDESGRPVWEYPGASHKGWIDDCYALNVSGAEVWTCYYSNFPIVRIGKDDVVHSWSNSIPGAKALAVSGDRVALGGGYRGESDRIVLLRLEGDRAIVRATAHLFSGEIGPHELFDGRGDILHLVKNGNWYRLSVSDVEQAQLA